MDDYVYFNQSVICIRPLILKNKGFLYFSTRFLINEIKGFATGAAQQSLNKDMIEKSNIIIPDNITIEKMDKIVDRIIGLEEKIRVLTSIKENLLSKYF